MEQPIMQFDIQFQPLQNQSLVMQQSQLIFPKFDLVIDKNGIKQYSNPQNTLTKAKIIPQNMQVFLIQSNLSKQEKQEIGRGSAGVVKRAVYKYENQQTIVAIKQISAEDRQKRNQLLNDLRTFLTGQMNIYLVNFYGCYYHGGYVKQVIEYMNLGSLRNLANLVAKKLIIINQAYLAEIIRRVIQTFIIDQINIIQILQGLNYIHKQKHQIHRDIKPENILINDRGQVKITDFGISKYIQNTFGQAQTFVGTRIYMSPERIGFEKKYDYKCDIWSLGLILYELATGNPLPYMSNGKQSIYPILHRIVNQNPPSLQGSGRSVQMVDFLNRSLQKNPQSRASASQLLEHSWIKQLKQQVTLKGLMSQVAKLTKKT